MSVCLTCALRDHNPWDCWEKPWPRKGAQEGGIRRSAVGPMIWDSFPQPCVPCPATVHVLFWFPHISVWPAPVDSLLPLSRITSPWTMNGLLFPFQHSPLIRSLSLTQDHSCGHSRMFRKKCRKWRFHRVSFIHLWACVRSMEEPGHMSAVWLWTS